MGKFIDLSGQQFGELTVIARDYKTQQLKQSKDIFWSCQCSCGAIVSKRGQDLRQGKIISCGCVKKQRIQKLNYVDLTNQRFGKLIVLEETRERQNGRVVWRCQCDCGNIILTSSKCLINGKTKSCGCIKSQGETIIAQMLRNLNIDFETQKTFEDCKNVFELRFDFYLPQYNILIEYNGKQHYEAVEYLGGKARFEQQIKRDVIKQNWCKSKNIKLIIIPYSDYNKISEKYLEEKIFNV